MANLFGSLYIGASGLRNSQYAMNTTANNLANVDTTGYVRQQVRFADQTYVTLKQAFRNVNMQQSGLGVTIGDVVHARDIFLDKAYRQEAGRQAFYSAQYETVDYVEDLMQELNGEEFKESISDLCEAFQQLSVQPEQSVYQNLVLEKAEMFVSRTQDLYTDFQNYQSNINEQIKDKVDRVNEIGQSIYSLNLQIQKIEAGGIETAMTLRDERDSLLDELATYGTISVNEDATGFVYVNFEYVDFVDDIKAYTIGLAKDTTGGTGFYTPYWEHLTNDTSNPYKVFDLTEKISTDVNTDVGGIKSLLMARGDIYGRYENLINAKDTKATSTLNGVQVEKTIEGYNTVLGTDSTIGSVMVEVEAELDQLFHEIVTRINDLYAPKTEVAGAINNLNLTGINLKYDETSGTYTNTVDGKEWIDENGKLTADANLTILDEDGTDITASLNLSDWTALDISDENIAWGVDGAVPEELFVRNDSSNYKTVTINGQKVYLYKKEDPCINSTRYGIGNVSINQNYIKQVTLMPAYSTDGGTAIDFGSKLREAWEAEEWEGQGFYLNPLDKNPVSFEEYYNKMVDNLGLMGNTYKSATETLDVSVASYDSSRQQVIGVSSDEELVNMIKYQSAYNAASRYITVISEMTEVIIGLI